VATRAGEERVVTRAAGVAVDEDLTVHFFDGGAVCRVREKRKGTRWQEKT